MKIIPTRIVVTGPYGRMGQELIKIITKSNKNLILIAALVNTNSTFFPLNINSHNIKLTNDITSIDKNFDILIDFSAPEATLKYLDFCYKQSKNMVIGTTGFNKKQKSQIKAAANKIGIVFSANFSVGINLMLKLIEKTTQIIGISSDIEIIEAHHRNKIDSPSGSALMMNEIINNTLYSYKFANHENLNNQKNIIKNKKIHFSSIRAGDIIGEHTVMFANVGERLEIIHKVSNRAIFAKGAIHAAVWLTSKKNGLFDMNDVLELDKL